MIIQTIAVWSEYMLKSPEFWMAMSFVILAVFIARPLCFGLNRWGKKRAEAIQNKLDEAQQLHQQATELVKKYELEIKKHPQQYEEMIEQAEYEIQILKQDFKQKNDEKKRLRKRIMDFRLQTIQCNGIKKIEDEMVQQIVVKTQEKLAKQMTETDVSHSIDQSLKRIVDTLAHNPHLIQK